jgi:hypothetical protein
MKMPDVISARTRDFIVISMPRVDVDENRPPALVAPSHQRNTSRAFCP